MGQQPQLVSFIATTQSTKAKPRTWNMTLRNRTGTETTDHVQSTLDRERLITPGEGATVDPTHTARKKAVKPSTSEQMENCEVCGRSFVKGRGLSIHQTKAGCKKIMESRKSKSKSTNSGLQDSNHSDSTKEQFHDSPVLKDVVSPNQRKKTAPVKNRIDPSKSNQKSENTLVVKSKDQEGRLIEKTLPLEKDNTPDQSQDQVEKVKAPGKVLCGAKNNTQWTSEGSVRLRKECPRIKVASSR